MPLSYKQARRILEDYKFVLINQTGSHQKRIKDNKPVIVPFHTEMASGTGKSVINMIARIVKESVKDLIKKYGIKF